MKEHTVKNRHFSEDGTFSKELSCSTFYSSVTLSGYNQCIFLNAGCPTKSKGYSLGTNPK